MVAKPPSRRRKLPSARVREERATPPIEPSPLPINAMPSGETDAPEVGPNLRRLRAERNLSLARLAEASGVSRAMLGQIELGQSVPTIGVLWKIARTLHVPFSALLGSPGSAEPRVLSAARARLVTSLDGSFTSRALFPTDQAGTVEFYELRLAAGASEEAEPHPGGTRENLLVHSGHLQLSLSSASLSLGPGDAVTFLADIPHVYRNVGEDEVLMFLVITYAFRATR